MSRVPPEIDQLMWAVAENPTPHAMDQFGERYPQHRLELLKRMEMVKGLRAQVRPGSSATREIPRFNRPIAPAPRSGRGLTFSVFMGLAAVAAACYTVYAIKSSPKVIPPPVVPRVAVEPVRVPQPMINHEAQETPPEPPVTRDDSSATPRTPNYLTPRKVFKVEDVKLTDALALITAGTGIKLVVGPGMPDQKVSVEYHDKNPVEMLEDMAKQYAFTISDEGDGQFLVIPLPDPGLTGRPSDKAPKAKVGP